MADLSALSDEELLALAQQHQSQKPDLSSMSDEKLLALKAKADGRRANNEDSYLSNSLRPVMRGLSSGFSDEIAAGAKATIGTLPVLGSGTWGERYDKELTAQRGRDDALDEDYPILSGAGQMAGALAGSIATPMIKPFQAATSGVRTLVNLLTDAGVKGGVAGFGEGRDGLGNRLEDAGKGGAIGTGFAGGLAGLGAVAKPIINKLANLTGLGNSEKRSERLLIRALERDDVPLDTLEDKVRFAKEGDILPDMAGRNTVNLAATSANVPGRSMETADRVIQDRRAGGPDRAAAAVETALGGGGGDDVAGAVAALQKQRSEAAAPLYKRAMEATIGDDEYKSVSRFVTDPIGQDAMQRGLRVIELEHLKDGTKFNPADYGVKRAEGGKFELDSGKPNMRLLDAIKNGYDDIVEGYRDKVTGKLSLDRYGDRVNQVRATYRDALADLNPTYGEALKAWSGPSASLDAVNRGRQAFRVDRDKTAAAAERLSEGDRPFFELGAGRALTDSMADPATMPGAARRLIENRTKQAQLQSVLPEDMRRDYLVRALQKEVDRTAVDRAVSPRAGSQTARLLAGADDMADAPMGGLTQALLNGATHGGLTGAAASGLQTVLRRGQGINPKTADALASRLFSTAPDEIAETVKRLRSRALADALARERSAGMAQRLISGGGAGASLQAN